MAPHDALLSLKTVALIIIIPNILFRLLNQQLTYHQYHTRRIPLSPCSYYKTEMYQTNLVCLEYVIISCGLFAAVRCCAGRSDPIQVSGGAHDRPAPGLRWCPYRRRHSGHWDRSWDADQSTSNVSICPSPATFHGSSSPQPHSSAYGLAFSHLTLSTQYHPFPYAWVKNLDKQLFTYL